MTSDGTLTGTAEAIPSPYLESLKLLPVSDGVPERRSFELGSPPPEPGLTFPAGSTAITGWLVLPSNIDWISNAGDIEASDGTWFVDLNGTQTGGIKQTFGTIPGSVYTVTFDLNDNNNSICGPDYFEVCSGECGRRQPSIYLRTNSAMGTMEEPNFYLHSHG